jgi:hypothetical protein
LFEESSPGVICALFRSIWSMAEAMAEIIR